MNTSKMALMLGAALCLSGPAFAQTLVPPSQNGSANSFSGSSSTAQAASTSDANSFSRSRSNATGGNATATGGRATGGNATTGPSTSSANTGPSKSVSSVTLNMYGNDGTNSGSSPSGNTTPSGQTTFNPNDANINYSGGYTIRNTPDASAPALYGGTNPCSVGVSGGIAVAGFGMSAGSTWSDRGCERRNGAVILFQANMPDVAVALLCEDTEMRSAFTFAGKPCPQDRAVAKVAAVAPAPMPAPAAVAAAQPIPAVAPVAQPAPTTMAQAAPQPAIVAEAPASRLVIASATAPAAPEIKKASTSGYRGAAPKWCGDSPKTPTDQAFYNHYCK